MILIYKYLAQICNKFVEIYTSIKAEISSNSNINNEKIVCLVTSNFIFSFLLSFTIDLYNFIPLTAKKIIPGINSIFWNSKEVIINIIPFPYS